MPKKWNTKYIYIYIYISAGPLGHQAAKDPLRSCILYPCIFVFCIFVYSYACIFHAIIDFSILDDVLSISVCVLCLQSAICVCRLAPRVRQNTTLWPCNQDPGGSPNSLQIQTPPWRAQDSSNSCLETSQNLQNDAWDRPKWSPKSKKKRTSWKSENLTLVEARTSFLLSWTLKQDPKIT